MGIIRWINEEAVEWAPAGWMRVRVPTCANSKPDTKHCRLVHGRRSSNETNLGQHPHVSLKYGSIVGPLSTTTAYWASPSDITTSTST